MSGTMPPRRNEAAEAPVGETRTDAARPEAVRGGGGLGWIVAIALILGGVAVSPWWAPAIAPLLPWSARPAPAPQTAPSGETADAANRRLGTLEQRVGTLATANASEAAASVDPALLLALGQLRQALQGSGPFAAELAAATTLAADRADVKAALAPLAESAARGVPSIAILRQRFDGLAGAIADAGAAPVAAGDWSGQVLGKLRGLVTLRRVGPAAGEGPEATVAQAENALASDDLAGAVATLETLHGPAMVAARDWLEAAHPPLAAEAALGKATALVTARLAADRQPVAPAASGAKP